MHFGRGEAFFNLVIIFFLCIDIQHVMYDIYILYNMSDVSTPVRTMYLLPKVQLKMFSALNREIHESTSWQVFWCTFLLRVLLHLDAYVLFQLQQRYVWIVRVRVEFVQLE